MNWRRHTARACRKYASGATGQARDGNEKDEEAASRVCTVDHAAPVGMALTAAILHRLVQCIQTVLKSKVLGLQQKPTNFCF